MPHGIHTRGSPHGLHTVDSDSQKHAGGYTEMNAIDTNDLFEPQGKIKKYCQDAHGKLSWDLTHPVWRQAGSHNRRQR